MSAVDELIARAREAGKVRAAIGEVQDELNRATTKFGPMASGHEALAVIEEEFLEFRSALFWGVDQKGQPSDPRAEAVQLAAMAIRYLIDVAD
jgi:hypothetical protein